MPAQYLIVYDKIGRPVEAKTLVDSMGLDVVNPRTGSVGLLDLGRKLGLAGTPQSLLRNISRIRSIES